MTDLYFLPWARAGAATTLNAAPGQAPANRAHLSVDVAATSTASSTTSTSPVHVDFRMLGPGDVVGLNTAQVIRTEPADGAVGVETRIFPAIDLDDPTLPWLFTPDAEGGQHRLRPWLCLVVVRVQAGVTLDRAARTLTIAPPADASAELPDLTESWAWAHVQYAGSGIGAGATAVAVSAALSEPAASLSRLVSPRELMPNTRYLACVVPTYAAGVQAGLGGTPGVDDPLADAWQASSLLPPAAITLPVYYSFGFTTGDGGDFFSLAQSLAHAPNFAATRPVELGTRTLDLTQSGLQWPSSTGQPAPLSLELYGILRPANAPLDNAVPAPVQSGLRSQLQPGVGSPQLRLPIYGAVQAGVRRADLATGTPLPAWLTQLNFDPRLRVFASLGAQVVASEQQDLVAAAWQQVEEAREVNALMSRAQLARSISARQFNKHVATAGDPVSMLQLTSPQASRMQLRPRPGAALTGTPWSVVRQDASDPALATTVSAAYRRLGRPRGPHRRRTANPAPAATAVTSQQVLSALTPGAAVENRVLAERVSVSTAAAATGREDPIGELSVSISYPSGMVVPLARLAPDALLSGVGTMPSNTALSLATNPSAIAAYMVGLNHEITRELLWRGVPIDRRATPFTWFWDVRGQAGTSPDISTSIADWSPTALLENVASGAAQQLVLAVRADLFLRYPRTAVYAVRAVGTGAHMLADETVSSNVRQPQFTATLPPDLRLFGFDIAPAEAIASPGWFFVFQEQASETRFGSQQTTSASYWNLAQLQTVGAVTLPASAHAAHVAEGTRLPPVRCAIHARALLPTSGDQ